MKKLLTFGLLFLSLFGLAACMNKTVDGSFYTLNEAVTEKIVDTTELQFLSFYYSTTSTYPDKLPENIKKSIIQTRVNELKELYPNEKVSSKNVKIVEYIGVYNEGYAIIISDDFTTLSDEAWSESAKNITFNYPNGNRIYIWKQTVEETNEAK